MTPETAAVLDRLVVEYEAARAAALTAGCDADMPGVCRYCGKPWGRVWNTQNPGHAQCLVPVAFKRTLVERTEREPALTFGVIATAFGVTYGTVRAWYHGGLLALGRPGLR